MVSNRLRLVGLATLLCVVLFYRLGTQYDDRYLKVQQPWKDQSHAGAYDEAKVGSEESNVPIPTPTGAGQSEVSAESAVETEQKDAISTMDEPAPETSPLNVGDGDDGANKTDSTNGDGSKATTNESYEHDVHWSRFAYTQYVTSSEYLCNSVMMFEALHRLKSKADRLMMYPSYILDPAATQAHSHDGRLLLKARDEYDVKLMPIEIQHREGADITWADSFTKLLAFNQTQYERVLSLDSDGVILQHMDELFLLPPCPVAMPRAYWLLQNKPTERVLSSQVMLIQPSTVEFERIMAQMDRVGDNDYDMEIVNQLYYDSALILPHRPYDMLTAEYRRTDHADYLGTDHEAWDPVAALGEAKFVHFSDWPIPKPWLPMEPEAQEENQPNCTAINGGDECAEKTIWNQFYTDFAEKRQRICHSGGIAPHSKRRHWLRMEKIDRNE
ncbi:nucleotide-diphospho-sugar transferase [Dactylonectria estremocensis]|uniref:Nucleotide-diphospho-sugar transferase n=1 Tax=Dactylonectria estremocensis TaxID=1079267 RepID=A0A9P9JHX2_9HYPO|nr:nucleotide-diphospho-sugar transferase [Dactylonectria estremocensis]